MKVAIASGKGGTGKTTLTVNLARAFGGPIQVLDCDVEAPNTQLFLAGELYTETVFNVSVPEVNIERCDGCGMCSSFCAYGALAVVGGQVLVFQELCHSCGGCIRVCPRQALHEVPKRIGVVQTFKAGPITLLQGRMDIGVAAASPLIRGVKAQAESALLMLLDAPPGTACSVVTTIRDADFVLLVTEPTPFGLHDLRLAVELARALDRPCGVIINRVGSGDDRVQDYCHAEQIPVLGEVPDDRRIAEAYSRGALLVDALPEYRPLFSDLLDRILLLARP